jgi:chromosome segregation protein
VVKEGQIEELNKSILSLQQDLRIQELALANKETTRLTILEHFTRIKEEEDLLVMELSEVSREITVLEQNSTARGNDLMRLNTEHRQAQDLIQKEECDISQNNKSREELLVVITQTKTELEGLNKRTASDETTLKILEDTYKLDQDTLENLQQQTQDNQSKKLILETEIKDCENKIEAIAKELHDENDSLSKMEARYREISEGASGFIKKIESDRLELDGIKNKLYELQMGNKDIDYKYLNIKDRMLQAYKTDIEGVLDIAQQTDSNLLTQAIGELKKRLDAYGTVNLVAIEEYDELKKRYDFLIQQQNDLACAKESLHEAILKINRTAKKMFLETFERVKEEFRNYFRLLFNGGDAQVFLIDEQDPLESGIEIICRPPGKKLQNVLLLSGGEKSLSAIALIFAIFRVKPSPFCILDEIDAALDEANVDRFSKMLQEFTNQSQFIVITHNKKTIANADVMYGITMEESGISKIVSVKFSQNNKINNREPEVAVVDPV